MMSRHERIAYLEYDIVSVEDYIYLYYWFAYVASGYHKTQPNWIYG